MNHLQIFLVLLATTVRTRRGVTLKNRGAGFPTLGLETLRFYRH
jgi:hypothetical protein